MTNMGIICTFILLRINAKTPAWVHGFNHHLSLNCGKTFIATHAGEAVWLSFRNIFMVGHTGMFPNRVHVRRD